MRSTWMLFVLSLLLGFAAGFALSSLGHSGGGIEAWGNVSGPVVFRVRLFDENLTVKGYSVNVTLLSHLDTPVEVREVRVYVLLDGERWVKAERDVIGGIDYSWYGDELLLPGHRAVIRIDVDAPADYNVTSILVAVELVDGRVVYVGPLGVGSGAGSE